MTPRTPPQNAHRWRFYRFYEMHCFVFQDTMGWGENDRGVSFTFGAEVAAKFLHKHDFDLICRAHQVVEDGKLQQYALHIYWTCQFRMTQIIND